jgi:hypothetical protein
MMKTDRFVSFAGLFIFGFALIYGCASSQTKSPPGGVETTCVQGKVRYRSPVDSSPVPYGGATVSAWRADKRKEGLAETVADDAGNYCLDIPKGDYAVDLRVWGAPFIEGNTYLCQGSVAGIELGSSSKKCGEGCQVVDVTAGCKERVSGRR